MTPAAQYLRASTSGQGCSLQNQRASIVEYAGLHGFEIVRTYKDPGRSGVTLQQRPGLMSLLGEVVSDNAPFRAIIVFDVSRWGRFQDEDEGAHYEYICKSHGIPIVYCAEPFANDGSMVSMVFKSLKRTMAGEFSRHLGEVVFSSQSRLAAEGFHIGNCPCYGLRRLLISEDGKPKQIMAPGERQSLQTDRTILVPGPQEEVSVVRKIYRMALQGVGPRHIAEQLRRSGIVYADGKTWRGYMVTQVLRNPKYAGINVWNRTTAKLGAVHRRNEISKWIVKPHAFEPIVSQEIFARVQELPCWRTTSATESEALEGLRELLKKKGRLSQSIIQAAHKQREVSWGRVNYLKMGSWEQIYAKVGFKPEPAHMQTASKRSDTVRLTARIIGELSRLFPDNLIPFRQPHRWRKILKVDSRFDLSVITCRQHLGSHRLPRWLVSPGAGESQNITLLCLLSTQGEDSETYYLVPKLPNEIPRYFNLNAAWMVSAIKIESLQKLYPLAKEVEKRRRAEDKLRDQLMKPELTSKLRTGAIGRVRSATRAGL